MERDSYALFFYLLFYLPFYRYIYQSFVLSDCQSFYLPFYHSFSPSIFKSLVCLSFILSVCISNSLPVCRSFCQSIFHESYGPCVYRIYIIQSFHLIGICEVFEPITCDFWLTHLSTLMMSRFVQCPYMLWTSNIYCAWFKLAFFVFILLSPATLSTSWSNHHVLLTL